MTTWRKVLAAAFVLVASIGVLAITRDLAMPARLWLVFLLVLLPPVLVAQAVLIRGLGNVEPESVYLSSLGSLWILAATTAVVVWASGIAPARIGLRLLPAGSTLAWAAGTTAVGLLVLGAANIMGVRESPFLRQLIPRTGRQKRLFIGLSITAGFCEELVFRGFLIDALAAATGMVPLAVVLSSCVFGLLHAYQYAAGAIRAAVLGTVLAIPFIVTGSLVPSMVAHAAIDVMAGVWLRDRLIG